MTADVDQERTVLLAALMGAIGVAALALVVLTARPIVALWVIAAVAAPWIAFSVYLRQHRDDTGREGRYVDLWSIPHFVGGALFGLFGLALGWVLALVVAWELIEIAARVREHSSNRIVDVVLPIAAWALANALAGGGFPLI